MKASETAFLDQIRSNQGIIYKLVGLYASNAEEKKDLYQEVLLQTWKAWPSFRGEAKFSTWLYRICLNTILTQKRKIAPIGYKDALDEINAVIPHPGEANQDARQLQWAIRQLGETDRAIISMHLDGYSNDEMAAIIGITNNSVAVKLHRIKQQLINFIK
jgi:RNA polymerase sigma factor (sigma-70 family)